MNAVGKLGTFISKGVYTVSGPFHPFGGAVDIVVVQQEDGSFKSSPWYVRFGKFQGVLKSKENVVTISVNGVEAGFNMFLDHTGQTFFLRDLEDGEDQYFLSLSTSGDETEVMAKEERFKKRHSFDVGVVQREQETRVDQENDDILTATSSRRSTIFGFAFGRKSTKESDTGENLGRVSSMERAEIAADLLEKKWSTNLKSSGPSADLPEVETSTSSAMKVSDANEERLEKPSPNEGLQSDEHPICNEKTDDNYGTGSSSRNCLEQEKIDDPSYLNVSKETKEISTTTNSDKTNSKTVVRTRNYDVDPQIYNFDTDETGLGNTQVKNYLNKKNLDEVASNEVAVQIYTVETGDSFHRNELNSELVTVQSNKTDVRNPDSTAFDEASQPHSSTLIGTTAGMPTCVNGEEEMSTFGDSGAIAHSTGMSNISDEKNSERLSLPSGDIEHCKNEFLSNLSCTIPEVTFVSETIAPLGKKISNGSCAQNLESRSEEYFVSEESQYCFARHGAFGNSDNKGINTDTNADSISEQFSCVFPHLSNQELLNSDHEFTSTGAITKEFSDLGNRDAFRIPYFPVSLSSDTLNSSAATGSYSVSDIPNSFNSINAAQNIKVVEGDVNLKRSYSPAEANAAQDICIISTQTEADKFSASCSKNIDDVQFPFSDIDSDNFDSKEIETRQSNDGKTADMPIQAAQRDTGELDLGFKKNELTPRETSDDLRNHYVPINTSDPKTSYGETELFSRSLPIIRSHINNLEGYDFHHSMSCSLNSVADIRGLDVLKNENFILSWLAEPQTEVIETGTSIVANTDVVDNEQKQKDNTTNASVDGADTDNDASRSIMPSGGSWNLWPFLKRSKTVSNTLTTSETTKEMDVDPPSISTRSMTFDSSMKKDNNLKVQSLTPTTEELSTLNLKEGQNLVKFSFSTSMLGSQQVDARIYLWKWNTRIVISDVDGTITRSDVLGQFMPLVGIDWSQTGVTHLFSAIKDNGYQLLFLSARSISQAHITRQFLSNLKQDGKALPEGPVLISPDGLFPSLYREVIRRAPHEFKISCLEDIKALFPPDYNPFYAGFGNRDTDTISYLKVGIPMGKIFIIDPKGQIVVNRQVDTRSYASLHDLVNEIFPSMSSFEQEDYNSWNYWKLPVRETNRWLCSCKIKHRI